MVDDPRIFKPEVEQQQFLNAVNSGFINPDGTRAGEPQAASVGGGIGFAFTMVLLPFITALLAAVAWIGGVAGAAPRLRSVLTGLLPQTWVAQTQGDLSNPVAVGAVLGVGALVVLTGLLLVRRSVARRWVHTHGFGTFLVGLGVFGLSAVMVLVLIVTPGLLLVGMSIATGADLASAPLPEGASIRAWPLVLTAGATAWFALGATRRAARKRSAVRASLQEGRFGWAPFPQDHGNE